MVALLRNMNEEIGIVLLIGLLEVSIGLDLLEAAIFQEASHIGLAEREHVEMKLGAVGK
jgi:hypothetical protein